MGRSEQKAKEREAARQRSLVTPTPRQAPAPRRGLDLRRGGGVRNRDELVIPSVLQTKPISTPQGGKRATPKAKAQKPAAPAKPAVDNSGSNGARGENRSGVKPVNGSFRTAVEQGPDGGATPSSGNAGSGNGGSPVKPDARINANGLVSYGRDLGSLNAFTSAFTGGYEIADIKTAFQSEDLPMKGSEGTNTDYSLSDAQAMGVSKPDALTISQGGFVETLITPSASGTTGNNPVNAQDGTSDKPDIAESVRTLRMQRKGPRDDGSIRGFRKDNNNRLASMPQEEAPDPQKIAQQNRRNQIRSTFLDMDTPIIQASVAANALAGYGKNSDGEAMFNYGGELVQAKDGMQQQAKNAAMMGRDPSEFLAIKLDAVKKGTKETK